MYALAEYLFDSFGGIYLAAMLAVILGNSALRWLRWT